jgi:CRISPR/Cas system-associated exonuclease Cas4 (RecB family)
VKQFRISAKNLAQLNIDNTCERCFWNLARLRHRVPFNIFPGIFSTFDRIQKTLVENGLENTGQFPKWLGEMADASGIADTPPRLEYVHQGTNIVLVGVPDHVYEWSDGSVSPVDYKTARFSNGQDALKPLYEAQLDAYSFLLEVKCRLTSDRGALVYFEPKGEAVTLTKEGFTQPWIVHVVGIEVSGERTKELLARARDIYDLDIPPDSRAECPDCDLLQKVLAVTKRQQARVHDSLRFMTSTERARHLASLNYQLTGERDRLGEDPVPTEGTPGSLMAMWDWAA